MCRTHPMSLVFIFKCYFVLFLGCQPPIPSGSGQTLPGAVEERLAAPWPFPDVPDLRNVSGTSEEGWETFRRRLRAVPQIGNDWETFPSMFPRSRTSGTSKTAFWKGGTRSLVSLKLLFQINHIRHLNKSKCKFKCLQRPYDVL